jgi:hypothetical protein
MGTITTRAYCLVKDGKAYEGTKAELVWQLCPYSLRNKTVTYQVKGYNPANFWYGQDWLDEEIRKDIAQVLFNALTNKYGFKMYKDIGF